MSTSARSRVRRLVRIVYRGGPGPTGEAWARRWLNPAEWVLWASQPRRQRRHAVAAARNVAAALGDRDGAGVAGPPVAAALLQDVGKVVAGAGPLQRTAAAALSRLPAPIQSRLASRRVALYLRHGDIGAGLLRDAGSDPLVVAWAAEHHLPPDQRSIAADLGAVLAAANQRNAD